MWFSRLRRPARLSHPSKPGRSNRQRVRKEAFEPKVEILEERTLLSFFSTMTLPTGSLNPLNDVIGDFSGDGRMDMAFASPGNHAVYVLLNTGKQTFSSPIKTDIPNQNPVGIAAADLNGDGKLDLITANPANNTITVLLGKGDGTFQLPQTYSPGTLNGPIAVAAGDLDGDHKMDLVVANSGNGSGSTVSVLLGNGNGSFQTPQTLNVGTDPQAVVLADLNGDQKLDLLVSNRGSNSVDVFLGKGDGAFQSAQTLTVGTNPIGLAVGDLNNDGHMDVAVANSGDGTVSIFLGDGTGNLQAGQTITVGSKPQSVAIADFNRDGSNDLAVVNTGDNDVSLLLGNGDATFQNAQLFSVDQNPSGVALGDLTGNGFTDLAVVGYTNGTVSLLVPRVTQFLPPVSYQMGNGPAGIVTGDFNGDGITDIATVNSLSDTISIRLGNRDGTFKDAVSYNTGLDPSAIVAGDFNRDGLLDLAVVNRGSDTISVFLGNANGTFQQGITSATGHNPFAIAVGNINQPGSKDLAVLTPAGVDIMLNNGNGTFRLFSVLAVPNTPSSVAIGDFDRDNHADVVVTSSAVNSSNVRIFFGLGGGNFRSPVTYSADGAPSRVIVSDLNHDRYPDLIVANASTNDVSVLINSENGTFQNAVNYGVGSQPSALVVADFNRDGNPDIAVANAGNASVSVLQGNGDGTFQTNVDYPTGPTPSGIAAGFFAGGQGLVTADGNGSTILLNRAPALIATGEGPNGAPLVRVFNAFTGQMVREFMAYNASFTGGVRVAMGDVEGEGVQDIVTAPGPGITSDIKVWDGVTGALIREFNAYNPNFTGGAYVAVGDVNHDGYGDIVTGTGSGIMNRIKVFSGLDGSLLANIVPFNTAFTGGVRVAAGDVNGDGFADIIAGAGPGGQSHIKVYSGADTSIVLYNFMAFPMGYNGGTFVAAGDLNGDGRADIIVGTGPADGAGSIVRVFSGLNGSLLQSFAPYPGYNGGVTVGTTADVTGTGRQALVLGIGGGSQPQVNVLDGTSLAVLDHFYAYDLSVNNGVFVGGG